MVIKVQLDHACKNSLQRLVVSGPSKINHYVLCQNQVYSFFSSLYFTVDHILRVRGKEGGEREKNKEEGEEQRKVHITALHFQACESQCCLRERNKAGLLGARSHFLVVKPKDFPSNSTLHAILSTNTRVAQ